MPFTHPEYLLTPAVLAQKLDNPDLRVFDAAVHLSPNPKGGYQAVSGLATYFQAHIPGAAFLDQLAELSDTNNPLGFTRLADEPLIQAFAAAGVNADSDVVIYSSGHTMWATRAWWLLHYCGHQRVAILDGGLQSWQRDGRQCSVQARKYAPTTWESSTLPHRFVNQAEVLAAITDSSVCTVNALAPEVYAGTGNHHYGRRGHIPGSINVHYDNLLDGARFRPADEVRQALAAADMLGDRQVIAYCGGGISATIDAFACLLLGKEAVAVYDGSMSEWVKDEALPLVEGHAP